VFVDDGLARQGIEARSARALEPVGAQAIRACRVEGHEHEVRGAGRGAGCRGREGEEEGDSGGSA
jgi:hypothetical protein